MTVLSGLRHLLAFVLFCTAMNISPAYAEGESGKARVEYMASNDSLSVDVQDAELNSVLMNIASQAEIRVLVDPEVNGFITTSFYQQPMREALEILLGDFNVITFFEQQDAQDGQLRVAELRILPNGKEESSMLRSIEDLQKDLRRQNNKLLRANASTKTKRKRAREEAKVKSRLKRIESLKVSDPELYEKKITRLQERYPDMAEWFE